MCEENILPMDNSTKSNKISFAVGVVLDDTLEANASAPSESEIEQNYKLYIYTIFSYIHIY